MVETQNVGSSHSAAGGHPAPDGPLSSSKAWLVPLIGLIFFILLAAGFLINGSAPNSNASGVTVINYYTGHVGRGRASALLTALSIPAGLFFFVFLREYLRRSHTARPFATLALVGAVLFAATGCLAAGLTLSLTDVPTLLTPFSAQALNVLSTDLSAGLLIGGLSTMQLGFGIAFLVSHLFPKWLGWLTIVIAVVSMAGPLAFFGLLATGIWVLIVSGMLYPRLSASASDTDQPDR